MGRYFGTDGFRGEANVNLTAEHAYRIGRFLGWYYGELKRRAGAKWASAEKALIDILRVEFGFDGFVLTDMADSNGATYMTTLDGMLAGTDAWLSSGNDHSFEQYRGNATIENLMRESVHRIMYVTANYSAAMNGMSSTTIIVPLMAWWEIVLIAVLIVFGVLTAGSVAMLALSLIRKRKNAGGHA